MMETQVLDQGFVWKMSSRYSTCTSYYHDVTTYQPNNWPMVNADLQKLASSFSGDAGHF